MKRKQNRLSGVSRRNKKALRTLSWFWAVFLCVVVVSAIKAQEPAPNQNSAISLADKIVPIGESFHNNIALLNNRFRIDAEVDKVILVFFREFGSPPVVLVQPNGSKLILENDANDDSFNWFESDTYDMIELISPMAGPWQALGEVLPDSKVLVIDDLVLDADAIPSPLFSGETLKQTALLRNAGEVLNQSEFADAVTLSIDFISTNNPEHENFGLGTKNIARFTDNGLGLDEKRGDGIFTGQFNLDIINGEWQPVFSVRTPLFSREQQNDALLLLPNPIRVSHIEAESEDGFHRIIIDADPQYIDNSSLMLDGSIRAPQGETEQISATELGDYVREFTVINSAYGIYRVNVKAYAQTLDGREIVLDVPEYSFVTQAPVVEVVEEAPVVDTLAEALPVEEELTEPSSPIFLIVGINLALLLIGGLVIFLIADIRRRPDSHFLLQIRKRIPAIRFKRNKTVETPAS